MIMSFPGNGFLGMSRSAASLYEQVTGRKDFSDEQPKQRGSSSISSSASNNKRKQHKDPTTHRIIEKRRRDKMNTCLAELNQLISSTYVKRGRNRIEKTEIMEMAIRHIKHLQAHTCTSQSLSFETKQATVELQKDEDKSMDLYNNKAYKNERYDQKHCTTKSSTMINGYPDQLITNGFFGVRNPNISQQENQHSTIESNVLKCDSNQSTIVAASTTTCKTENVYKFKKNIKERFAAGLQQPVDNVPTEKGTITPALYECCLPKTQQSEFSAYIPAPSCRSHLQQDTGEEANGTEEESVYYRAEGDPFDSTYVHSNFYTSHFSRSTGGSSSGYNTDNSKYKNTFSELSSSTSFNSPSENSSVQLSKNLSSTCIPKTPIFALHPTGNFYIPLVISASNIESYIHSFDNNIQSLHPVSICVNFGYPNILTNKFNHMIS